MYYKIGSPGGGVGLGKGKRKMDFRYSALRCLQIRQVETAPEQLRPPVWEVQRRSQGWCFLFEWPQHNTVVRWWEKEITWWEQRGKSSMPRREPWRGAIRGRRRGWLSWKQREGNFEARSDQCSKFCRKGHSGGRTELLDLAFQKASNLFQRSCSKALRQELQCRGLSGGRGQSKCKLASQGLASPRRS